MKWICSIFFLTVLSWSFGQNPEGFEEMCSDTIKGTVPTISVAELNIIKREDPFLAILDARESNEFKVSHIENAANVGYDDFNINSLNGLPKDATIVVYCSIGYRSERIGEQLLEAGFTNVKNLKGGIFGWYNYGLPVYDKKEKATDKIHGYDEDWSQWLTKDRGEILIK